MPRKLTDAEVDAQKEFMYGRTVELISRKGISSITLDDILDAVQMAKGSFYKYYVSKELFLYEVIKKNERVFFDKMIQAAPKIRQNKDSAIEVMRGLFTNKDSHFEIVLLKTPSFSANCSCIRFFCFLINAINFPVTNWFICIPPLPSFLKSNSCIKTKFYNGNYTHHNLFKHCSKKLLNNSDKTKRKCKNKKCR